MSGLESVTAALADRYRVEREAGAGGMASVFLAEDLKHRRKVAVKVLRPELAASLGKDRFIREIEIAAQLAHPHILPLLDSGEASGLLYYVMPFVEGESLRDRLVRSKELPVHETIRILTQVADALAYAHARGLVHRDIKPENVMMSGRHALVTDFGVAKALSEATGRHQLTSAGIALGTPAYMAPEQAVADPAMDHRVDIYAIGAVGYELLAGRPPFSGVSAAEVLASHVTRAPEPLTTRKPSVPQSLGHVIMKCLEKAPEQRWQTADELFGELERLMTPSTGSTPTASRPLPATVKRGLSSRAMAVGGVGAAVVIAGIVWAARDGGPSVTLGARTQVTLDPGLELDPALSPNGSIIAYVAGPPGGTRLFVRQMGTGAAAVAVAQDVVARAPKWSPDGSQILFTSPRGVEIVPYMGGAATLAVASDSVQGADWAPEGRRVTYAVIGDPDTLYVRSLDGGDATMLASADEIASPAWSPDGRWIAYSVGNTRFHFGDRDLGNLSPSAVWVVPATGGTPSRVSDSTSLNVSPAWLPEPGTLLYVSSLGGSRDIYAARITGAGRVAGPLQRLTTGLSVHSIGVPRSTNRVAYATYTETVNAWRIRIPSGRAVSISGAEPVTRERQIMEFFRVSPDGQTLVFDSDRGGRQHIYRMPIGGGAVQQLTTGEWDDFAPVWSHDGRSIAYHSSRTGDRDVYVVPASGGSPQQLTTGPQREWMVDWSRQGEQVAFVSNASVGLITRSGSWSAPALAETLTVRPRSPVRWSPDGRSIAFYGRDGLRVLRPGAPPSRVIVRDVHGAPQYLAWSEDGSTVYYESTDASQRRAILAVPATGGSGRPLVLFDDPIKQPTRFTLDVNGGWLYLTLGDRQADVSVVDFSRR